MHCQCLENNERGMKAKDACAGAERTELRGRIVLDSHARLIDQQRSAAHDERKERRRGKDALRAPA